MAKRRSEEARVLAYFTSAPIEKAELMLGLVKDQVRTRTQQQTAARQAVAPVRRRGRKAKAAQAGAGTQPEGVPIIRHTTGSHLEMEIAEMERAQ